MSLDSANINHTEPDRVQQKYQDAVEGFTQEFRNLDCTAVDAVDTFRFQVAKSHLTLEAILNNGSGRLHTSAILQSTKQLLAEISRVAQVLGFSIRLLPPEDIYTSFLDSFVKKLLKSLEQMSALDTGNGFSELELSNLGLFIADSINRLGWQLASTVDIKSHLAADKQFLATYIKSSLRNQHGVYYAIVHFPDLARQLAQVMEANNI